MKTLNRINEINRLFGDITNNKVISGISELYKHSEEQVDLLHFEYTIINISPKKIESMFFEKELIWEYLKWSGEPKNHWNYKGLELNDYIIQDFHIRIWNRKENNFVIGIIPDKETKKLIDNIRFEEQYSKPLNISNNTVDINDIPTKYQDIIKEFFDDFSNDCYRQYEFGNNLELDKYFKSKGLNNTFLISIYW